MATKAYYPVSEIGAGKVGFSKTRSIIEAAFYGNPFSVVVLGKFRRFHFPILFIYSPEPRFFPYLLHIFNALFGLFLFKNFFEYVIMIVLYSTLSGGPLWHTI